MSERMDRQLGSTNVDHITVTITDQRL